MTPMFGPFGRTQPHGQGRLTKRPPAPYPTPRAQAHATQGGVESADAKILKGYGLMGKSPPAHLELTKGRRPGSRSVLKSWTDAFYFFQPYSNLSLPSLPLPHLLPKI